MSDLLSLDPQGMAEKLAYYDVLTQQTQLQSQQKLLAAQQAALKSLRTALTDFRSAMGELNKLNNGILQNTATVSKEGMADITVNSNASKGNYSFFVDKLASAHQVSFGNLTDDDIANDNGVLSLELNGESIDIDLNGINSLADLAAEINGHGDNPGATASLIRTNGQTVLMLSSDETGAANKITLSGSSSAFANAQQTQISDAADAEVWLGGKGTGLLLTNSSNTFDDIIEGVSIEFKQVHAANDSPLNVSIGSDPTTTKEQLNKFIDAYNTLVGEIDSLTKRGTAGSSGGAFAGDSGINSLKNQLNNLIRTPVNGHLLTDFGITASREGKLTLDSKNIDELLKDNPNALTEMFNGDDGLIKTLDKSLDSFLSTTNGQIKLRQEGLDRRESQIEDKTAAIEVRYNNSYNRYLTQFTQLQKILTQMNSTMSMFSSIAGESS